MNIFFELHIRLDPEANETDKLNALFITHLILRKPGLSRCTHLVL